jgi:hypothetical protein
MDISPPFAAWGSPRASCRPESAPGSMSSAWRRVRRPEAKCIRRPERIAPPILLTKTWSSVSASRPRKCSRRSPTFSMATSNCRRSTRAALLGAGYQALHADFTPQNGATRTVPGSPRFAGLPSATEAAATEHHPDEKLLVAPAGTVIVFNSHLCHGGHSTPRSCRLPLGVDGRTTLAGG